MTTDATETQEQSSTELQTNYHIDYDIITGKIDLNESQAISILMQLWDNAIKAGIITAQDTVLIHKAIKLVSEKILPEPPETLPTSETAQ